MANEFVQLSRPQGQKPQLGESIDWSNSKTKDLVGCWIFNESSGNIIHDLSGNGNDGAYTGGNASWVSGEKGPTVDFVASDSDRIDVNGSTHLGRPYTLVWRQRIDGTTGERQPFGFDFSSQFTVGNGTTVMRNYDSGYLICPTSDAVGEYVTYAFIGTDSSRTFYRNGTFEAGNATAALDYGDVDFDIGSRKNGGVNWEGAIDYFYIFNRALNPQEIQSLYADPYQIFQQPKLWYLAEEEPPTGDGTPWFFNYILTRRIA